MLHYREPSFKTELKSSKYIRHHLRKILIISPHFPPSNLAAVHRSRLFAQHLLMVNVMILGYSKSPKLISILRLEQLPTLDIKA